MEYSIFAILSEFRKIVFVFCNTFVGMIMRHDKFSKFFRITFWTKIVHRTGWPGLKIQFTLLYILDCKCSGTN